MVGSINNNISFTKRHENDVKAFYAAEAGIEKGINMLLEDKNNIDNFINNSNQNELDDEGFVKNLDNTTLENSEYVLHVKNSSNNNEYVFKTIGNSGSNGNKEIVTTIKLNEDNGVPSNALTSNNTINLASHHGIINGDIFSSGSLSITTENGANDVFNGNIYSKGATSITSQGSNKKGDGSIQQINGNIYSGGSTTLTSQHDSSLQEIDGDIFSGGNLVTYELFGAQQNIEGNIEVFSSDIEFPIDNINNPFEFYFPGGEGWQTENWPSYNSINNISLNNDIYRINGNQSPNNIQIDGSGIIVIDGSLDVKNNFKINLNNEDFVVFLVDGDVELDKHIEGNFFIYSNDKITINYQTASGKFDMNGSLMAENDITINSDHTSNSNSPNEFTLNFNAGFTEVFDDLGYNFPQLGNNNSNNNSTTSIEVVSWQEN